MSNLEPHPSPGHNTDNNTSPSAPGSRSTFAAKTQASNAFQYSHFSTESKTTTRPLPYVHPTRSQFITHYDPTDLKSGSLQGIAQWSSRASRKNRYSSRALHVKYRPRDMKLAEEQIDETSSLLGDTFVEVMQRLRHPSTKLKARLSWDISFWVAVVFILGTTAWIINGFFLFLPFPGEASDNTIAAAWSAIAGGILFELGSYLMYVEALNAGHEQLFGPTVWGLAGQRGVEEMICEVETGQVEGKGVKFRWIGIGSWRELGFIACFIQWSAMSIFLIPTLMGLLGVILVSSPVASTGVIYWTLQVIGGCGFTLASVLFMLEEQNVWWRPAPFSVGWHVGLWNLIGSVGFTLCGAYGCCEHLSPKAEYQSVFYLFWGSWAFMIGSLIQFWETLWREE